MTPTVNMVKAVTEVAIALNDDGYPQAASMSLWLAKAWRSDLERRGEWKDES